MLRDDEQPLTSAVVDVINLYGLIKGDNQRQGDGPPTVRTAPKPK